jgi:HEPN domain-containing protein
MKPLDHAEILLAKAAEDESLVIASLETPGISDSIVGFHTQQAVEKLLKALLQRAA